MLDKLSSVADGRSDAHAKGGALAVLVVGMHRSGTSALTGVLALLGIEPPADQHAADEHNARGYFEPQRIIDFHEDLFAKLGSPSNDPLPTGYDWVRSPVGEAAAETLADLLEDEFAGQALRVFKDPRMCRLMPVWTEALHRAGLDAVAVLPCRSPLEVAGSLKAKAGLSRPYALFMWLQHVLLAERFTRGMRRSFTLYDDLMGDWRAVVGKLERDLGLAWPRDLMRAAPDIDAFLSGELRHHSIAERLAPHDPLEVLCAETWGLMARLRDDAADRAAQAALDRIWARFEADLGLFGPLVVSFQGEAKALRAEIARILADAGADIARVAAEGSAEFARVLADARHLDQRLQQETALRLEEVQAVWGKLAEAQRARAALRGRYDEARREVNLLHEMVRERDGLVRERDALLRQSDLLAQAAMGRLAEAQARAAAVDERVAAIENSTSWRLTHALRSMLSPHPGIRRLVRAGAKLAWWTLTFKLGRKLGERGATAPAATVVPEAQAERDDETTTPTTPATASAPPLRIAFLSGEPDTPGHLYRVVRYAEAARMSGAETSIVRADQATDHLDAFRDADLVVLWRAAWDDKVAAVVEAAEAGGATVLFDVDDLIVEPKLAEASIIVDHFERLQRTLKAAHYASAPTPSLAQFLEPYSDRGHWKASFILPNGFDEDVFKRSRLAARRWRMEKQDDLIRIGYATGSKTHQADFREASAGLARVLREHPQCRLLLYKGEWGPVLDIAEFAEFDGLTDQIEWRDFVAPRDLPSEVARFDINIAPLELGNVFCEAKSELKYFEAALVDVPTVASPTEPFRLAIRPGETGFLAAGEAEWYATLKTLVASAELRRSVSQAALYDSLVRYGPERRAQQFLSAVEQMLPRRRRGARAFAFDAARHVPRPSRPPEIPDHEIVLDYDHLSPSDVTVVIPLFNYEGFVVEALDSIGRQTLKDIDLVVVDDGSTDGSLTAAKDWIDAHAGRFGRALLVRNSKNSGLALTRNVGFANADTPYVLPLDADNRLLPTCAERLLETARETGAAFAYPHLRQFGDARHIRDGGVLGTAPFDPGRFRRANFIDALALVRRGAWAAVGGYDHVQFGWEDYDFWCKLLEAGEFGEQRAEVLAEYRVHGQSMLRSETDLHRNKMALIKDMERRHPWLRIDRPDPPAKRK